MKRDGVAKSQKGSATSSTPASTWELGETQSRIRRDQLTRWWDGGKLEDGESFWNRWLHRLITVEIPWRRTGISPWLQAALFTESMVAIEGTKKADRGHFTVSKSRALRDGLEALVTLQTRPLPKTDLEHHRHRLVRLVRKLEPEVTGHARRSLNAPGGNGWSPVGLVVQIALVRAWLRGTLSPRAPLPDQWAYLFEEEPSAEASPKRRVETWLAAVQRTAMFSGELEKRLRHMVNLPRAGVAPGVYGSCELAMADPAEAVSAIKQLLRGLELSPYPSAKAVRFDNFIDNALKIAEDLGDLPQIPTREGRRLLELAAELEASCPGDSVQERARRVQDVMIGVSKASPGAPNEAIQGWTQRHAEAYRGLFAAGNEERVARVDDFKVDGSRTNLEDFGAGADLLAWCIRAPADDLFAVRELFRQADVSIAKVLQYAEDLLKDAEAAGGATLQQLHAAGERLQGTCDALVDALREET